MSIIIYVTTSVILEDTISSIQTLSGLRLRRQSGGWMGKTHDFPTKNQVGWDIFESDICWEHVFLSLLAGFEPPVL